MNCFRCGEYFVEADEEDPQVKQIKKTLFEKAEF